MSFPSLGEYASSPLFLLLRRSLSRLSCTLSKWHDEHRSGEEKPSWISTLIAVLALQTPGSSMMPVGMSLTVETSLILFRDLSVRGSRLNTLILHLLAPCGHLLS